MQEAKNITIVSNRRKIVLGISTILYVIMKDKNAEIHVSGGKIYATREPLCKLEDKLGDGFIKVHRGCILFDISEIKFTKNRIPNII